MIILNNQLCLFYFEIENARLGRNLNLEKSEVEKL
jgi:hypothetical protein